MDPDEILEEFDFGAVFSDLDGVSTSTSVEEEEEGEQNAAQEEGKKPPASTSTSTPADEGEETEIAQLRRQQAEDRQMAQRLSEVLSRTQEAPVASSPVEEKAKKPAFVIQPGSFGPELTRLIQSEDPAERINGLASAMSAMANLVWDRIQDDITKNHQPNFTRLVEDRLSRETTAQTARNEFAAAYPWIKTEKGAAVASYALQKVVQELAASGTPAKDLQWGPDFKKRFDAKLVELGVKKTTTEPTPKKQTVKRTGGARTGTPGERTLGDEMLDVVLS
jgi:hypothetical protein